jgi:radical SAM superfamily enzyme YgiQ (UPF0313 family)
MRNILLVNPWICDFALYDLWVRPFGLMRIAALLKAHGYNLSYIDFLNRHHPKIKKFTRDDGFGCGKFYKRQIQKPDEIKDISRPYFIYGLPEEVVNDEVKNVFNPDIIFMTSGMTYWYPGLEYTAKLLKKVFPDVPIALGGIYATLLPEHAKNLKGIDYVVKGADLPLVCSQISKILNKTIQPPEYYIYPEYSLFPDTSTSSLVMETSKGCPFNCSYCGSKQLNKKFIQREPKDVLEEIGFYWQTYGVKDIAFYDDALLVSAEEHIIPILDGICKMGLPINFHTPNGLHAKFVDKKLAKKLKKANFKTIRLSLETVNSSRQENTGGKVTSEELKKAVENLKIAGYTGGDIGVYLMFGMPHQEEKEVREGIEFLHSLKVTLFLASYSLVPGTSDERMLKEEGIVSDDLDPLWHNNTIFPLKEGNFSIESIKKLRIYAASLNRKIG